MPGAYYERNLPHWQEDGRAIFITWRLSGSLPVAVMSRLRSSKSVEVGKRFRDFDIALDAAGSGPLWLKDDRVAELAGAAIARVAEQGLGRVHAWVVMPNHVHVLMEPKVEIGRITQRLKGRTAREANVVLGRTGQHFWQEESFDHWVRHEAELVKIKKYIEENPVAAGLVEQAEDWKWSSAGRARV